MGEERISLVLTLCLCSSSGITSSCSSRTSSYLNNEFDFFAIQVSLGFPFIVGGVAFVAAAVVAGEAEVFGVELLVATAPTIIAC